MNSNYDALAREDRGKRWDPASSNRGFLIPIMIMLFCFIHSGDVSAASQYRKATGFILEKPAVLDSNTFHFVFQLRDDAGNPVTDLELQDIGIEDCAEPAYKFNWSSAIEAPIAELAWGRRSLVDSLGLEKLNGTDLGKSVDLYVLVGFREMFVPRTSEHRDSLLAGALKTLSGLKDGINVRCMMSNGLTITHNDILSAKADSIISAKLRVAPFPDAKRLPAVLDSLLIAIENESQGNSVGRIALIISDAVQAKLPRIDPMAVGSLSSSTDCSFLWLLQDQFHKKDMDNALYAHIIARKGFAVASSGTSLAISIVNAIRDIILRRQSCFYRLSYTKQTVLPDRLHCDYKITIDHRGKLIHEEELAIDYDGAYATTIRDRAMRGIIARLRDANAKNINGIMKSASHRIPLELCDDIFIAVDDRYRKIAQNARLDEMLLILSNMENLTNRSDEEWIRRFSKDYLILAEKALAQKQRDEAYRFAGRSIAYMGNQENHGFNMRLALGDMNYQRALPSVEWLYEHGTLSGSEANDLIGSMVRVYAGVLDFEKAFQLLLRRQAVYNMDDIHRWVPLIVLKGKWIALASRYVALAMAARPIENDLFSSAIRDLKEMDEFRAIAVIDNAGQPLFSYGPAIRSDKVRIPIPTNEWNAIAHYSKEPTFFYEFNQGSVYGYCVVPVSRDAWLVCCFNDSLSLAGKGLFSEVQKRPNDKDAWRALRKHISDKLSPVALKTLGTAFTLVAPRQGEELDLCRGFLKLFESSDLEYAIANLSDGKGNLVSHEILGAGKIPSNIRNDTRANRNPFYMQITRTNDGNTVDEHTIALYQGIQWIGTLRIGIKAR